MISRASFCLFGAAYVLALATIGFAQADERQSKRPVPEASEQRDARKRVEEIFGRDVQQADTPERRAALARQLLESAADLHDSSSETFVLLNESRRLAALAGDAELTLQAIEAIISRFDVPSLSWKAEALIEAEETANSAAFSRLVAKRLFALLDAAAEAEKYELAKRLHTHLLTAAARGDDKTLLQRAAERGQRLSRLAELHAARPQAEAALEDAPEDAAASETLGEYHLLRGEWRKALPLLRHTADPVLRKLGTREQQPASSAADRLALADVWWAAAKEKGEPLASSMRARALYWYDRALPGLSEFDRLKAARRIEEASPLARELAQETTRPQSVEKRQLLPWVDPSRHAVHGHWVKQDGGLVSLGDHVRHARCRLPVIPKGDYQLDVEFTRKRGENAVAVMLPVGDRQAMLLLSGYSEPWSGLQRIDGADISDPSNPTRRKGSFASGVRHHLSVRVTHLLGEDVKISAVFDGEPYLQWQGRPSSLSLRGETWRSPAPFTLALGAWKAPVIFHSATLTMLRGEAEVIEVTQEAAGANGETVDGR